MFKKILNSSAYFWILKLYIGFCKYANEFIFYILILFLFYWILNSDNDNGFYIMPDS